MLLLVMEPCDFTVDFASPPASGLLMLERDIRFTEEGDNTHKLMACVPLPVYFYYTGMMFAPAWDVCAPDAWCIWRPEEGARSTESGIMDGC